MEGYGQTESAGHHDEPARDFRLGSVGRCVPGTDSSWRPMVRSSPGVRMSSRVTYNEAATAQTVDEDGWLRTGDIGNGYLFMQGEKRNHHHGWW